MQFTRSTRSNASTVVMSMVARCSTAALLTSTSMRPSRSRISSTTVLPVLLARHVEVPVREPGRSVPSRAPRRGRRARRPASSARPPRRTAGRSPRPCRARGARDDRDLPVEPSHRDSLPSHSVEHPLTTALAGEHPPELQAREVRGGDRNVGALELARRARCVPAVPSTGSTSATPAHSSSSSSTAQCTTSPSKSARWSPDDSTTSALPGVWPAHSRASTPGASGASPSHGSKRSSTGRSRAVANSSEPDEVVPVAPVAAVGRVRERGQRRRSTPNRCGRSGGG